MPSASSMADLQLQLQLQLQLRLLAKLSSALLHYGLFLDTCSTPSCLSARSHIQQSRPAAAPACQSRSTLQLFCMFKRLTCSCACQPSQQRSWP